MRKILTVLGIGLGLSLSLIAIKPIEASKGLVAFVYDPPSNVREYPGGPVICVIKEPRTIVVFHYIDGWWQSDACGGSRRGWIHQSQFIFY